ncbi:MAG: HDOD domain-containing protein, partial [Myxococcota bacterium]
MGEVFFAEHTTIARRAAIKFIRSEFSTNAEVVERFLAEARSVNEIRHPNIVEITDFGQLEERYYIVMELLEGETLQERMARLGPLPEEDVVAMVMQIAAAVGAAHEKGVVHRDLKPENIFLTNHPDYPNFVKVLDFGIAKLVREETGGRTIPGTLIGTPGYMSPEQAIGSADLDHRSDVYSLGIVCYEMLTGTVPFTSEHLGQLVLAHCSETPKPLREHRQEVSPWLEQLVLRTLAKRPEDRFESMATLRAALQDGPDAFESESASPGASAIKTPSEPLKSEGALAPLEEPFDEVPDEIDEDLDQEKLVTVAEPKRVAGKLENIVIERLEGGRLKLPVMPSAAINCLNVLRRPQFTYSQVSNALEGDPMLASLVLRRANSAIYGGATRANTLEQAASRLGSRQLESILIEASAVTVFNSKNPRIRQSFQGIWKHSIAVATAARKTAQRIGASEPEQAYIAGLLHEAGKPIVGALLLEAERMITREDSKWMTSSVWQNVVESCFCAIGESLASSWNLPAQVVTAIRRGNDFDDSAAGSVSNVICFANALAEQQGFPSGDVERRVADLRVVRGAQLLGLVEADMETVVSAIFERLGPGDGASGTASTAIQTP